MSDDSFIREVNEELRQDKVKEAWTKFGRWLLIAVVILLAATAAYVGWDRYQTAQADASGDRYLAALDLAAAGQHDEAVAALEALVADGHGAYPDLARMRIGSVREAQGEPLRAVEAFDVVAADSRATQSIRDMAAVRAAYILVDHGSVDDVRSRVERLTGDSEPLRFPAREAVALAAWKAGDEETASSLFRQLVDDTGAPRGISARARLMLEVVAAGAPAAERAAPADAPAATAEPVADVPAAAPGGAAPASPDGNAADPVTEAAPFVTLPATDLGSGSEAAVPAPVPDAADAPAAGAVDADVPAAAVPPASSVPPALAEPVPPAAEPAAPQGGAN
jgi:hypothetical protein